MSVLSKEMLDLGRFVVVVFLKDLVVVVRKCPPFFI